MRQKIADDFTTYIIPTNKICMVIKYLHINGLPTKEIKTGLEGAFCEYSLSY